MANLENPFANIPAPAKINRFLHVIGRRADGYHDLQTAFQFVEPTDRIELALRSDGQVVRTAGLADVPAEQDLAVRAARLLREKAGQPSGCNIAVHKRIPDGAGLGGGSSDAASVLVGLNRLWGCALGEDALADLGRQLGSDVPVFVRGRAAWGEGVGERLKPMDFDRPWILLAVAECKVPTAAIFRDSLLTTHSPPIKMCGSLRGTGNDCEYVTFMRFPAVKALFERLSEFGPARMSGTGGSVFVRFDDENAAKRAQRTLPRSISSWVCQTRNASPLRRWLAKLD